METICSLIHAGSIARGSMKPICPLVQVAWPGSNLFTCTGSMARGGMKPICPLVHAGSIARGSMEPICPLVQAALPEEA